MLNMSGSSHSGNFCGNGARSSALYGSPETSTRSFFLLLLLEFTPRIAHVKTPSPLMIPRSQRGAYEWPAWSLSLVFHAVLLVVLGLLLRPARPQGAAESDRPVQIAAFRQAAAQVEYFVEAEESQESATSAPQHSASSDMASALPSETAAPPAVNPELALPAAGTAPAEWNVALPGTQSGQPTRQFARKTDYSEWVRGEAARLAAQKPRGPVAELTVFGGAAATGRSFVFVIDRSKSMGSGGLNALAAAERELAGVLQALEPSHRFAVLAYHHEVVYLEQPRLLPATEANKRQLGKFFGGLAAYGQTEHQLGIQAGLALSPDVLYVFTDAGEPIPNDVVMRRMIREAQRQNTTIHTIRFGLGEPRDDGGFLRRLAEETGGGYTYVML